MILFICRLLVLAVSVVVLGGCGNSVSRQDAAMPVMYTVTDSTGFELRFHNKPQRIVSMSVAADEILMAMVEPVRILALTRFADDGGISNITEQARQISRRVEENAEAISAMRPDLVIIPSWKSFAIIQTLRDAGIPVYVYKAPRSIAEIKQNISQLALLVGEPERGRRIVEEMDDKLAKVQIKIRNIPENEQKVVMRYTLSGGSNGSGSTFDNLCREAGVKNGAAIAGLGSAGVLSKEQIIKVNPDVLILPQWNYSPETNMDQFRLEVQNDPALQSVAAVRDRRLLQLPERHVYCSSQYIVFGVRAVAEAAYPQLFRQ